MTARSSGWRREAWILAVAVPLVGCAAGNADEEAPALAEVYATEVALAREAATSDFERAVLSDGVITDEEFSEARSLLQQCVRDQGFELTLALDGASALEGLAGDEMERAEAAFFDCQVGTTAALEVLYYDMTRNPEGRDLDELMAECLVRAGVVDEPFSGRDYGQALEGAAFDVGDARHLACVNDPLQPDVE